MALDRKLMTRMAVSVAVLASLAGCIVAPAPGYVQPVAYGAHWVPAHWNGFRWVRGHWA